MENSCEQFGPIDEKPVEPDLNTAFAGLKAFNRTRWCAIIQLMKTHQKYADTIKLVLERSSNYDLILTLNERDILNGMIRILEPFQMLSVGAQATQYPTLNMELLFKIEIETTLAELAQEFFLNSDQQLCDAIDLLKSQLDHRFPTTDFAIAAAILDPAAQHLSQIDAYLSGKQLTKLQLLEEIAKAPDIDLNNNGNNEQQPKRHKTTETLKTQLLSRHINKNATNQSTLESELMLFKTINDSSDINDFYRTNESRFPCMSKIAKPLLLRPITTSKSEAAFSTAGLVVNSRRAAIDPLRAHKVLFIHDNYDGIHNRK